MMTNPSLFTTTTDTSPRIQPYGNHSQKQQQHQHIVHSIYDDDAVNEGGSASCTTASLALKNRRTIMSAAAVTDDYYFSPTDYEKFYSFVKILLHLLGREHQQRLQQQQQQLDNSCCCCTTDGSKNCGTCMNSSYSEIRQHIKSILRQYARYHDLDQSHHYEKKKVVDGNYDDYSSSTSCSSSGTSDDDSRQHENRFSLIQTLEKKLYACIVQYENKDDYKNNRDPYSVTDPKWIGLQLWDRAYQYSCRRTSSSSRMPHSRYR